MSRYNIEIGENQSEYDCHGCKKDSYTGHGFVYKNNDAYAVYYAAWSELHIERCVSIAIAIGEWSEGSSSSDRVCLGLEAYEDETEILFKLIDPDESPWPNTDLMGNMISREAAKEHFLLSEVYEIVEQMLRKHPAIREYLKIPEE